MNANILSLSTQFSFRPGLHEGEDWEKILQLSSLRVSSPGDVFTNTAVISTKREERKFIINRFNSNLVPRVPQLDAPWSERGRAR